MKRHHVVTSHLIRRSDTLMSGDRLNAEQDNLRCKNSDRQQLYFGCKGLARTDVRAGDDNELQTCTAHTRRKGYVSGRITVFHMTSALCCLLTRAAEGLMKMKKQAE
ncbi:hypothetical protein Bbelb_139560 [Branchiostoma belcheri]|nr:hypothetical protein Bbelb_139560 [Branchiostoma belcheri]